jgi:outer membrane protein assembly factor BamB
VGSNDGSLYALNAATGAKLWSYNTGNDIESSPVVADGAVYVISANGTLYKFHL